MNEMLKIPACTSDKASQLRLVYDKIGINIRGLESLGVSSHQYGSLLIPVIVSKLPHDIRIQVARNTAREVWEMSDQLEVIQQEVKARENSEGVKTNVSLGKLQPNHHKTSRNSKKRWSMFCLFKDESSKYVMQKEVPTLPGKPSSVDMPE